MLNKKAIAAGVLVGIIAMLIVFIVLFRLDIMIANLIKGGAEDQICFWSAGMSSFSKAGPKTITKLYCNRRIVHVMLNSNDIPAATRQKESEYVYINKPITKKLREKLNIWYEGTEDFQDKNTVLKYRLNEVMAKELKRCWGNLGKGTYNLFDEDFTSLGFGDGFKTTDSLWTKIGKSLDVELRSIPKVCFTCSTLIFEGNVNTKFEGEEIDLKQFLLRNPVNLATQDSISYYEFLEDNVRQGDLFRPEYTYTTDRTYAVVFMRVNLKSYIGKMKERFGSSLSEIFSATDYTEEGDILAMDYPLLIPFSEVSTNCDKFA